MVAAPTPEVTPADRSISPSSSTNTRPMASSIDGAACVTRLARLPREKKPLSAKEKKIARTISAPTAGSEPMSPPRTRAM